MACATCKKAILFGGKRAGNRRYCSKACCERDELGRLAQQVPEKDVQVLVERLRTGQCRSCRGHAGQEWFQSYFVYSAVVLTSWRTKGEVSCRACARKRQARDLLGSFTLGWWGIPFGLAVTPVMVGANLVGMLRNPLARPPSKGLVEHARLLLAHELWKSQRGIAYAPIATHGH